MATWVIKNMERMEADGAVTVVHWSCEDGDTAITGTSSFEADSSSDGFIAYADLTESTVLGWIENKDAVEAALEDKLTAMAAPQAVTGMPWSES